MFTTVSDWFGNPLGSNSGQPSGYRVFLFVGLVIVIIAIWANIFQHIRAVID